MPCISCISMVYVLFLNYPSFTVPYESDLPELLTIRPSRWSFTFQIKVSFILLKSLGSFDKIPCVIISQFFSLLFQVLRLAPH